VPFTTEDLEDAYDLDGFADVIHQSRRTAERIVARREVDFVRTGAGRGQKILIPRRAAEDYINRQAVTTRRGKAAS